MRAISLLVLIIVAICLRYPFIGKDLPYLYNEDEAHHFNRTVQMVKDGTFDPQYFHKPSFHFYLRMPVVASAFLWQVSKGNIRSVSEMITQSRDGVGGYAFSVSHPGILKWNRALSVLLSVLTVILVFLMAKTLELSPAGCFFAALFSAICPELIAESAVVGVDVVVVFLCVLAVLLSLVSAQSRDGRGIVVAAVISGLAVSTKYNAFPVLAVPAAAALFSINGAGGMIMAILVGIVAFFIGSPYILKHIPLFLDHFAYEIWHYKIAGHEGHSADPGFQQLLFYGSWFVHSALGWVVTVLAILGIFLAFHRRRSHVALVLILFPVLYIGLMVNQRANFTRNMLVMVPFFSIFAVIAAEKLSARFRPALLIVLLAGLLGFIPLYRSHPNLFRATEESRSQLAEFIAQKNLKNVGIVPGLQMAQGDIARLGLAEISTKASPLEAKLQGFSYLVTGETADNGQVLFTAGVQSPEERIVKNPRLHLVDLKSVELTPDAKRLLATKPGTYSSITLTPAGDRFSCRNSNEEPYCWLQSEIGRVEIPDIQTDRLFGGINGMVSVELEVTSPWDQKGLKISFSDFLADISLPDIKAGENVKLQIKLPYTELKEEKGFFVSGLTILSPKVEGRSVDNRRLGLAIKSLKVLPQ